MATPGKKLLREVLLNERYETDGPKDRTYTFRWETLSDDPRHVRLIMLDEGLAQSALYPGETYSDVKCVDLTGLNVDDCEALAAKFAQAAKVLRGA